MPVIHIANVNPVLPRAIAGGMLALAVFPVVTAQVDSESMPLAIDWFSSIADGTVPATRNRYKYVPNLTIQNLERHLFWQSEPVNG